MKRLPILISLAAMLACATAIAGETKASKSPHVLALVQVNDQGKITRVEPAYPLSPKLENLLQTNLAEMMRNPAVNPNGKPTAGQFVMDVALQSTPLANGTVAAEFVYVATKPLAPGRWHWARNVAGHQLALVNADNRSWSARPDFPPAPPPFGVIDPPQISPMFAITPTSAH